MITQDGFCTNCKCYHYRKLWPTLRSLEATPALERAMLDEDRKQFHRQQEAAHATKSPEIHTQMAQAQAQAQAQQANQLALKHDLRTVRADREVQEAAERLLKNQRLRERARSGEGR